MTEPVKAVAAQESQPARADEFARVKVRLCALVASLDETVERGTQPPQLQFDQGAAHASAVTARQLREILTDTALGVTPQPAPGPDGQQRYIDDLHDLIRDMFGEYGSELVDYADRAGQLHVCDTDGQPLASGLPPEDDDPFGVPVVRTGKPEIRTITAQPAPELADAKRELREVRQVLTEVLAAIGAGEFVAVASAHLNKLSRWHKSGGIEQP
jgi:hypothetical protein